MSAVAWNGNSYQLASNWSTTTTVAFDLPGVSNMRGHRHVSRNERRLLDALARMKAGALARKLAKLEASRLAMSDAKSRQRRPPHVVGRDEHRRLPTYEDAMAARMASRRSAP